MKGDLKPKLFAWVPSNLSFSSYEKWFSYPFVGIAVLGPLLFALSFTMMDVPPTEDIPWTTELPGNGGESEENAGVHWFKMEVEVTEGLLGTAECTSNTYEDEYGNKKTTYRFRDRPIEESDFKLKSVGHSTFVQSAEFSAVWDEGGYAQFSQPGLCTSDSVGKIWDIGEGYEGEVLAYEDSEGRVLLKATTYGQSEFPQFLIRETVQRIGAFLIATSLAFWAGMIPTELSRMIERETGGKGKPHNFIKMEERDENSYRAYSKMLKKELVLLAKERGLDDSGLKKELIQRLVTHEEKMGTEEQINLWEDSGTKREIPAWNYPYKKIDVWDSRNRYGPDLDEGELMQEHPVVLGSHRPPILTNYSLAAFASIITWTWLSSDLIARHHGTLSYGIGIFIRYATLVIVSMWMIWSIRKWFVYHLVIDTPTQTIQSIAVGDAELCGQIRPGVKGTISADIGPWRLDGLIAYSWTQDVWVEVEDSKGRTSGSWQRVDGDKKFVDSFILHDGSAGIKVNGKEWFDKEVGVQPKLSEGDSFFANKGKVALTGACLLLGGLLVIFVAQFVDNKGSLPKLYLGVMIWSGMLLILSAIMMSTYYLIRFTHYVREPAINIFRKLRNPFLLIDYGTHMKRENNATRWELNCIGGGDPLYIIGKVSPRTSKDLEREGLSGAQQTELLEVGPREALETSIMQRGTELQLMRWARSTAETAIIPILALISSIIPFIWM